MQPYRLVLAQTGHDAAPLSVRGHTLPRYASSHITAAHTAPGCWGKPDRHERVRPPVQISLNFLA